MKVCVFGNSHIAAMHLGWKQIAPSYPQTEVVFFGAPNGDMSGVDYSDATLVPTEERVAENFRHSGGSEQISLADYDAIVIVGCRIGLMHYHRELGSSRLFTAQAARNQGAGQTKKAATERASAKPPRSFTQRLRGRLARLLPAVFGRKTQAPVAQPVAPEEANPNRAKNNRRNKGRIISRTFMSRAIEQMVRASRLYYFADNISSEMDLPVFFVASPHASTYSLVRDPKYKLGQTVNNGWNEPFADVFWSGLSTALAGKATVVRQPEETVVDHVFTREEYSLTRKGTNASNEEVEMIDNVHMNAAYGAIVMRELVAQIAAATGEKDAPKSAVA